MAASVPNPSKCFLLQGPSVVNAEKCVPSSELKESNSVATKAKTVEKVCEIDEDEPDWICEVPIERRQEIMERHKGMKLEPNLSGLPQFSASTGLTSIGWLFADWIPGKHQIK